MTSLVVLASNKQIYNLMVGGEETHTTENYDGNNIVISNTYLELTDYQTLSSMLYI
jgi:hypothetical protein